MGLLTSLLLPGIGDWSASLRFFWAAHGAAAACSTALHHERRHRRMSDTPATRLWHCCREGAQSLTSFEPRSLTWKAYNQFIAVLIR